MTRSYLAAALFAVSLAFAGPASADADAESFVKDRQSQLTTLIKAGKSKGNDEKIAKIFDGMIDYQSLARESLRSDWDRRSDAERVAFQCVLKQLVQNAYRGNLDKTLDYAVTYRGQAKGKRGLVVRTIAKSTTDAREEPVTIDYIMAKQGNAYQIVDIVTEGSSLVSNYRNQFRRIIKKDGFPELMRRMKKKLAESGTPVTCA